MARLSISKAWDETKVILARDGRLLTSVALALVVLPAAIMGMAAPPLANSEPPTWIRLAGIIASLVAIAGQLAIIRLALGSPTTVGEAIAHGFRRLLPTFIALLLYAFALGLLLMPLFLLAAGGLSLERAAEGTLTPEAGRAALLVILVVVAITARFQMITPVGSAESIGPVRIVKRSWQLTKGNYWRLLAFILLTLFLVGVVVLFLGQILGTVVVTAVTGKIAPFSIGALVAGLISGVAQGAFTVVISVMNTRIYAQLVAGNVEASVPSSGD